MEWDFRFKPSDRPSLPPRYRMCPVCHRYLVNIRDHMESDHPDWVARVGRRGAKSRDRRSTERPPTFDWTPRENRILVRAYFWLLAEERRRLVPKKVELLRKLAAQLPRRSRGSIEFKLENVSAVLNEMGYSWIEGYKPAANYQVPLRAVVLLALAKRGPRFARGLRANSSVARDVDDYEVPPPHMPARRPRSGHQVVERRPTKWAIVDAANRKLGLQGEDWIIQVERARLRRDNRHDLARRVRWISKGDGDAAGYDIQSFTAGGSEVWIEVKTTNGPASRPFLMSRRELKVWRDAPGRYRL
jgi:hypothetical protein